MKFTVKVLKKSKPYFLWHLKGQGKQGHRTKEKKWGSTIKRAVGNPSQQSDQRSKSGAGSGLQRDIPRPKPGRSSSSTITVGTQGNKHVQDVISAPSLNTFKNRLDEAWINYKYCTDLDWFKNPNPERD